MMKRLTVCAAVAAACLGMAAHPGHASAQRKIDCESQVGRRTVCEAGTRGGVFLHEQKSVRACVYGQTWGYTASAVWVSDGCRGEFMVDIPPAGSAGIVIISADEALRICRNTVMARLEIHETAMVRVDLFPPTNQPGRSFGWVTQDGHRGTCRVSASGDVIEWTNIRNP